jgi:Secretion system C-terminal sorting domain
VVKFYKSNVLRFLSSDIYYLENKNVAMKKCISLSFFLLFNILLSAQMHYWTGAGGDQNWFNGTNWDTGEVPEAGSVATISGNFTVDIIDLPAFAAIIDMDNGATLNIENNVTLTQAIFTESSNTIVWRKGIFDGGIFNLGLFVIESSDSKQFKDAFFVNYNQLTILDSSLIQLANTVTIDNEEGAILSIEGGGGLDEISGIATLNNYGWVTMTSNESNAYYMVLDINNYGTISLDENQTMLILVGSQNFINETSGVMEGKGAFDITANFTNHGLISPGGVDEAGMLEIVNNMDFPPDSVLEVDIYGPDAMDHDVLRVFGFPILEGNFDLKIHSPLSVGDEITVIIANDIVSCNLPSEVSGTYGPNDVYYFEVICESTTVTLKLISILLNTEDHSAGDQKFEIFPNPTSGAVFYSLDSFHLEDTMSSKLEIFNLLGQSIMKIPGVLRAGSFNISNLEKGVYLVNLQDPAGINATAKIVKQ